MKIEDYNEYYIQGSDHYLIPKDEFKELFNEMVNWREESNKQKEVMNKTIEELEYDNVDDEEMKGYLIQRIGTFKEILRKYKSIIGDIDENN